MTFNATWSMAVGGMVGGGIFSVLGVVIATAAEWAWLSFVLAGMIALISAHSYSALSVAYREGGGAFTFLREIDRYGFAGSVSWLLFLGYILTISVYGYTFGHYVANAFGIGSWLPPVLAVAIIAGLVGINLRGVGTSADFEIGAVWFKLAILLGLAVFGLVDWSPSALTEGVEPKPWSAAIVGAAMIFMAYEGFQLLAYDYGDLKNPDRTLPRATISAVVCVIAIYVVVTLGTTMLVGAQELIQHKEVALATAGRQALGDVGFYLVTAAAAFSTGSAINATLFSTARLMESVAEDKDLPDVFGKENRANIPYYSILLVAGVAALLSVIGSLNALVNAASLIFLFTFGTVNYLAYRKGITLAWVSLLGALGCGVAIVLSAIDQFEHSPVALLVMGAVICLVLGGRWWYMRGR